MGFFLCVAYAPDVAASPIAEFLADGLEEPPGWPPEWPPVSKKLARAVARHFVVTRADDRIADAAEIARRAAVAARLDTFRRLHRYFVSDARAPCADRWARREPSLGVT